MQVLKEILKTCREDLTIESVAVDEDMSSSWVIRVGSSLNDCARDKIESILAKYALTMEESKDYFIIYSP